MLGSLASPLTVTAAGRTREYYVHFPETYDPNHPYPVVFIFHGDANLEQLPKGLDGRGFFGFEETLGEEAILVYMDGENLYPATDQLDENGQHPFFSWDDASPVSSNPDISYFNSVLGQVQSDYCVDRNTTFATGFSGGAFFVNSLACLNGGLTAIVTFEGGIENGELSETITPIDTSQCVDAAPAAMIVHTKKDTTVAYSPHALASLELWNQKNGCGGSTSTSEIASLCTEQSTQAARVVFCEPDCTDDADGDGVCVSDQHTIWNITDTSGKRQGPEAAAHFLRRFIPAD